MHKNPRISVLIINKLIFYSSNQKKWLYRKSLIQSEDSTKESRRIWENITTTKEDKLLSRLSYLWFSSRSFPHRTYETRGGTERTSWFTRSKGKETKYRAEQKEEGRTLRRRLSSLGVSRTRSVFCGFWLIRREAGNELHFSSWSTKRISWF